MMIVEQQQRAEGDIVTDNNEVVDPSPVEVQTRHPVLSAEFASQLGIAQNVIDRYGDQPQGIQNVSMPTINSRPSVSNKQSTSNIGEDFAMQADFSEVGQADQEYSIDAQNMTMLDKVLLSSDKVMGSAENEKAAALDQQRAQNFKFDPQAIDNINAEQVENERLLQDYGLTNPNFLGNK